jgi:hypothetical protein
MSHCNYGAHCAAALANAVTASITRAADELCHGTPGGTASPAANRPPEVLADVTAPSSGTGRADNSIEAKGPTALSGVPAPPTAPVHLILVDQRLRQESHEDIVLNARPNTEVVYIAKPGDVMTYLEVKKKKRESLAAFESINLLFHGSPYDADGNSIAKDDPYLATNAATIEVLGAKLSVQQGAVEKMIKITPASTAAEQAASRAEFPRYWELRDAMVALWYATTTKKAPFYLYACNLAQIPGFKRLFTGFQRPVFGSTDITGPAAAQNWRVEWESDEGEVTEKEANHAQTNLFDPLPEKLELPNASQSARSSAAAAPTITIASVLQAATFSEFSDSEANRRLNDIAMRADGTTPKSMLCIYFADTTCFRSGRSANATAKIVEWWQKAHTDIECDATMVVCFTDDKAAAAAQEDRRLNDLPFYSVDSYSTYMLRDPVGAHAAPCLSVLRASAGEYVVENRSVLELDETPLSYAALTLRATFEPPPLLRSGAATLLRNSEGEVRFSDIAVRNDNTFKPVLVFFVDSSCFVDGTTEATEALDALKTQLNKYMPRAPDAVFIVCAVDGSDVNDVVCAIPSSYAFADEADRAALVEAYTAATGLEAPVVPSLAVLGAEVTLDPEKVDKPEYFVLKMDALTDGALTCDPLALNDVLGSVMYITTRLATYREDEPIEVPESLQDYVGSFMTQTRPSFADIALSRDNRWRPICVYFASGKANRDAIRDTNINGDDTTKMLWEKYAKRGKDSVPDFEIVFVNTDDLSRAPKPADAGVPWPVVDYSNATGNVADAVSMRRACAALCGAHVLQAPALVVLKAADEGASYFVDNPNALTKVTEDDSGGYALGDGPWAWEGYEAPIFSFDNFDLKLTFNDPDGLAAAAEAGAAEAGAGDVAENELAP